MMFCSGVRRGLRIARALVITCCVVVFVVRYAIRQYVRKELGVRVLR